MSKGLRRLEQLYSGDFKGVPNLAPLLPAALEPSYSRVFDGSFDHITRRRRFNDVGGRRQILKLLDREGLQFFDFNMAVFRKRDHHRGDAFTQSEQRKTLCALFAFRTNR